MAEGGGEFCHEDPDLDNRLDHDSDEGKQEVDTTCPFQPGVASTPYQPGDRYHGGQQTEMSTFLHEQSGLPDTSYEETPLLGAERGQQRSWDSNANNPTTPTITAVLLISCCGVLSRAVG